MPTIIEDIIYIKNQVQKARHQFKRKGKLKKGKANTLRYF